MTRLIHEIKAPADTGLFEALANALPAMVWISDESRKCIWFNRDWLEFTGRTMEQELGDGWAEGVHPDDLSRCLDIYVSAFDARKAFEMKYRLRHRDGGYRLILDRGQPRYASEKFIGYIGGCLDVSEWFQVAAADTPKPAAGRRTRAVVNADALDVHALDAWEVDLKKRLVRHKSGLVVYFADDARKTSVRRSNAVDWAREDHRKRSPMVSSMIQAASAVYDAARKKPRK